MDRLMIMGFIIFFLSSFIFGANIVPLDEVEYPKSMIMMVDEGRIYLGKAR